MIIVGDQGSIYTPDDYGAEYVLLPRKKFENFKSPEKFLPRSPNQFQRVGGGLSRRGAGPCRTLITRRV